MRSIRFIHLLVIITATVLAYLNILNAGFLSLDDSDMTAVLQSSEHDVLTWFLGGGDYFRPLVFISYVFDLQLFGRDPFFFHLVNVTIHLFNAVLVYFLTGFVCRDTDRKDYIAFAASLLFALNPLNTEAVSWVSGRFDLLCALFFLLAMTVVADRRVKARNASFALFLFVLFSLLSKEASVGIALILTAYLFVNASEYRNRRSVQLVATSWLALGAYLFLRMGLTAKADSGVAKVMGVSKPFATTVFESIAACGFYLKKLFMPFPLNFAIYTINKPIYFAIGVVVLVLFFILFVRLRESRLPLLIIVVSLIPPLMAYHGNLPWTPYAERYLYIPSIGMSLLAGQLIAHLPRQVFIVPCSLILLLAFPTKQRVEVWADSRAFWSDVMVKSPEFPRSYTGVALELMAEHKYDEAERLFKKTLSMGYEREFIWQNLASIYLARKDLAAYEDAMCRAAELAPASRSTQMYLSMIAVLMNNVEKIDDKSEAYRRIMHYYAKAFEKDNEYVDGLYNAGKIAMLFGDQSEALHYFRLFLQQPGKTMYKSFARQLIAKIEAKSTGTGEN